MSVTITISNNRSYCDQYCPDKIQIDKLDDNEAVMFGCTEVKFYPFNLNLSNSNFADVWRSLGLAGSDFSDWCCGEISPKELLNRLKSSNLMGLVCNASQEGIMFEAGRTKGQIGRYIFTLKTICNEAIRRGELITWS